MPSLIRQKISSLQSALRRQKMAALVIGNFGHQVADDLLYYLLLKNVELGLMIIPVRGRPTLYAIPFEAGPLAQAYPELRVFPFDTTAASILKNIFKKKSRIAIRPSALPTALYQTWKRLGHVSLLPLRSDETIVARKHSGEIQRMRQVCRVTDDLFNALMKQWAQFSTEAEAATWLTQAIIHQGMEPSFPPIIASGQHAASPHHVPTTKKLQSGFCVIDIGVRLHGYCSDMTRTIYPGTPSAKERRLYETLRHAQEQTVKQISTGVQIRALDQFCRSLLGEALNKEFIHGLGHGVGTQVHEWPRVNGKESTRLSSGMIITIEPGVYRKNAYGIRIEDDILVTKDRCEILTKTPKKLIIKPFKK